MNGSTRPIPNDELIRHIDEDKPETAVVLGKNAVRKLKELLPCHEWRRTREAQ